MNNNINTMTAGLIFDMIDVDVFNSKYFEDVQIFPEGVEHPDFRSGVSFILTINNRSMLMTITHNWIDYFDWSAITIPNMVDRHDIITKTQEDLHISDLKRLIDVSINKMVTRAIFEETTQNMKKEEE
tara:strand:- start:985 stop:1368 length:384 start_codon:yes stop_codon:yes gene_type:complete